MKVLVACECSGKVRDAFLKQGHEAVSCDLKSSQTPGPHVVGDVLSLLDADWDLLIGFPPCTHLAISGARHFHKKQKQQGEALGFFSKLLMARVPRICLENPVSVASTRLRTSDQTIQPWQFGHDAAKLTHLWLKNLPKLQPTKLVRSSRYRCRCGGVFVASLGKYGCPNCSGTNGPAKCLWANQTKSGQNGLTPNIEDRATKRAETYQGIADAMAKQWGCLPLFSAATLL